MFLMSSFYWSRNERMVSDVSENLGVGLILLSLVGELISMVDYLGEKDR